MAKKKKVRVNLRKNRSKPPRPRGWTRGFQEHGPDDDATPGRERVRASVDRLPDFLRQVVILAYYQGLKYREIADILDIPVGTVKSRLHAALVKLQEAWAATPSTVSRSKPSEASNSSVASRIARSAARLLGRPGGIGDAISA